MRRFALAAVLTLAAFAHPHGARADDDKVVNFYNWTDYMDPHAIENFTKLTGIKVRMDTYDSLRT